MEKYSLHFTIVLEQVACHVTSKHLGNGSAERVSGNTKDVKDGKLVSCNSDNTEIRAIIYTNAKI